MSEAASQRARIVRALHAHLLALYRALDADPLDWMLLDRHTHGLYRGMADLVALEMRRTSIVQGHS